MANGWDSGLWDVVVWDDASSQTEALSGNLVLSTSAPTVAASAHRSIAPPRADLLLTTFAPQWALSDNLAVAVPVANLTLESSAPLVSVSVNRSVEVPAADLLLTASPPVSAVATPPIEIPSAQLVLSTDAPILASTAASNIEVPSADLSLSTFNVETHVHHQKPTGTRPGGLQRVGGRRTNVQIAVRTNRQGSNVVRRNIQHPKVLIGR